MDWETLGACNTYQFTVLDCPLDRQVAVRTALENRGGVRHGAAGAER